MLTVSMFTDAASLYRGLVGGRLRAPEHHLPSVVVIAIDVEDLVSLDTQNTIEG